MTQLIKELGISSFRFRIRCERCKVSKPWLIRQVVHILFYFAWVSKAFVADKKGSELNPRIPLMQYRLYTYPIAVSTM
jgi:hypothetical protein